MKEFMLFIKSEGNPIAKLSPKDQQLHIEKVGKFIKELVDNGKMKSAQPLEPDGITIEQKNGSFIDGPFNETKEVITGYYHILAADLKEAANIAKSDPRFEDGQWKIEIRPIMNVDGIN